MGPDDDSDLASSLSTVSTRAPFLPPCTPEQAQQAIRNSQLGLGTSLMGQFLPNPTSGLASILGSSLSFPQGPKPPGLAAALAGQGITSVPGCDPRLVSVTTNPARPAFQTAQGTVIQMNKPAPATSLPWGEGLDRLIKFADGTGLDSVEITGGTEAAEHTSNSAHPANHGIDVSAKNPLNNAAVRQAALDAGYTHGVYEIRPDGSKHWHLQVGPENIKNAAAYELSNGPIRTKDYTQGAASSQCDDEKGN